MLNKYPILVRKLVLMPAAFGLILLSACGQKGNLYLPTEPAATGRASLLQSAGNAVLSTLPSPGASATDTQHTPPAPLPQTESLQPPNSTLR